MSTEPSSMQTITDHVCYPKKFEKWPDRIDKCGTNTFCSIKFRIPSPLPNVHGSMTWFACVDLEQCQSKAQMAEDIFGKLCAIPACTVFPPDSSDRNLCMTVQTMLCDSNQRFTLRENALDSFALTCSVQDDEIDQHSSVIMPEKSLFQELATQDLIMNDSKMNSLVQCGVGYFKDLPSLLFSGPFTSLGSFDECLKYHKQPDTDEEFKYCTVNYDAMIHQGLCLPGSCTGPELYELLSLPCDVIRPSAEYRGSETCLDFVDSIPLNICLMAQVLGCNTTIAQFSSGDFDAMSLFMNNPSTDNKRRLYDWASNMPSLGPHSFKGVVDAVSSLQNKLASRVNYMESSVNSPRQLLESTQSGSITDYRYESPFTHKYSLRCGGWSAPLDGSTFNRAAGCLTLLLVFLLPFFSGRKDKLSKGLAIIPSLVKLWWSNVSSNFNAMIKRAYALGSGDFAHVCGLRSLNMLWVVVGHTFTFSWQEGVDRNFKEAINLIHDYTFQIIVSGQLAVDAFFFLSGLMFGLFTASRLDKLCETLASKPLATQMRSTINNTVYLSLKRYFRLMPTTAIILALSYWVLPYTGFGPMWVSYVDYVRYGMKPSRDSGCYTNWWSVLTLTSNLGQEGLSCMGHTWYLANDFQFYVLSIMIYMGTYFIGQSNQIQSPRRALYWALAFLFAVCTAFSYYVVRRDHLHFAIPAFSDTAVNPSTSKGTMDMMMNWSHFYVRPWCRIGPYLIGLVAGTYYRDRGFERLITLEDAPDHPMIDTQSPILRGKDDERSPGLRKREAPETPRPHCDYSEVVSAERPVAPKPLLWPNPYIVTFYTVLATVGSWLCVFTIPYDANKGSSLGWDETVDQLWFVFNRTIWALCLAWFTLLLVYVPKCGRHLQLLKPLYSFLSSKPMAVCSIFTYTFYLVHPFVEQTYYAKRTTDVIITNAVGWFASAPHFVETVLYGILASVLIEVPLGFILTRLGI